MAQNDRTTGLVGNAAFKVPVRAATIGNITLSGEQTIDGVACVDGDRVLVRSQTDATENGIYVVDTGDWNRAKDFDGVHDVVKGTLIMVTDGAINADTYWRVTTENTVEIDTDNIAFAQALLGDSSMVAFTQAGAGAVSTTVQARLREDVSVKDFGAGSSETAADNLAAFILAVAATPTGGVLVVPREPSHYSIDTSGGLSTAIDVNKSMTIRIEGEVRATFGAIQANPPCIFNVTGDDVTFQGAGRIKGDGSVNQVNTGTDDTIPALVRVTGDRFTMNGLTIDTPYKTGVHLYGCYNAKIVGNNFTGGPTEYADTAYFGVRLYNGGRHLIANNQFYPDAGNGMYVQCIFSNSSDECVIEGNVAIHPYEKLVYLTSSRNLVCGNTVIGNSGTIPGTNQTGTVGTSFRCDGSNNKVVGNYSIYGGGCSCRLGGGNTVEDNTFYDCGQGAIAIFDGNSSFNQTTVRNNVATCGNLTGVSVTHGIQINPGTGTHRYIDVSGNTIIGFGITDPIANVPTWQATHTYPNVSAVKPTVANSRYYTCTTGGVSAGVEPTWPVTPGNTVVDGTVTWTCVAYGTDNAGISLEPSGGGTYNRIKICDNNIAGGVYGIKTTNMSDSIVAGNKIDASSYGIKETTGGTNHYDFNFVTSASNPGVEGIAASSYYTHYEQGTWTPVISDGTNDATMGGGSSNAGKYTRVGRMITFTANVATSALGSVSGAIRIKGLPYTSATGVGTNTSVPVGFGTNFSITAGHSVSGTVQSNQNYIDLYVWDATTGATAMQHSEWTATGSCVVSGSYFV